ncbi:MAG: tyrosine-type recombinase/integrase [Clostridia bacterium]|nr:tyrosine-type recombinase/integrase [Clostridia bacterium]
MRLNAKSSRTILAETSRRSKAKPKRRTSTPSMKWRQSLTRLTKKPRCTIICCSIFSFSTDCDEQELAFKGLHAFRHAYATTAITSNAIDMKTVSAVLGHSQTSTTLNIYAHAVAEVNAKAVDVVEDIYTKKRKEA